MNEPFIGYRNETDGLYFYPPPNKDKDGNEAEQSIWLCARLEVMALTIDEDDRWGKLLVWMNPDQELVKWVMPNKLLADKTELWRALLDRGLDITANDKYRAILLAFLNREQPIERVFVTHRLGWIERNAKISYVLPDRVFGADNSIWFSGNAKAYTVKGTLPEWQHNVARLCQGNSRLVFAAIMPFAAPLLYHLNEPSGGFNYTGNSQIGKTKALKIQNSTAGTEGKSWRATDNGLEGVFEERCDSVISLDEMGEVAPEAAGKVAYMMANGSGKQRASVSGDARQIKKWRMLMLSSGEVTLADRMNEAGQKRRGGQEIRLVDIPADADAGMGILETLHDGFNKPGEFIEYLGRNADAYQGAAFMAYLEQIVPALIQETGLVSVLRQQRDDFIRDYLPTGAAGQVRSVCGRFAVVALAGELATDLGVTGWDSGEATQAAVKCFQGWLSQRGTVGDHDIEQGIKQVIDFVGKHGSRFQPITSANTFSPEGYEFTQYAVYNRCGYKRWVVENADEERENGRWHFYVLSNGWTEMTKGYNPKQIAKAMAERGLLIRGDAGLQTKITTTDGRVRVYHMNPDLLEGE